MLYGEYDDKTLNKLKHVELAMLKDFIEICDTNKIDYFLLYGSALGAIRHKGMIPWDDDIDIGLARKQLERLIKIIITKYSDKYEIFNKEINKSWPLMTTIISKKNTIFTLSGFENIGIQTGIYLDLYCFDNLAQDNKKRKKQIWRAWFWGKLLILRSVSQPTLYLSGIKRKIVVFLCSFIHCMLKWFHISSCFLYQNAKKAAAQYTEEESQWIGYPFDTKPFGQIYKKDDIFPTRICEFENMQVRIPNKTEEILERYYGDYMALPPVEKRHNHKPHQLLFDNEESG